MMASLLMGTCLMYFLFFVDFEVIYAITGDFGACSRYLFSWCETPQSMIDRSCIELQQLSAANSDLIFSIRSITKRREVSDLRNQHDVEYLQIKGIF